MPIKNGIFILPITERFTKSLLTGIEPKDIPKSLSDDVKKSLQKDAKLRVFGVSSNLSPFWSRIEDGDYILLYQKGTYRYLTTVFTKFQSIELAKSLWSDKENTGEGYEYVCLVNDLKPISISYSIFNDAVGYAHNYYPHSFISVRQDMIERLSNKYGSLHEFITKLSHL